MAMRVIYLHGFASGPQSSKAQFFRAKLSECGAEVTIPALDGGHFETLTITGQLQVIDQAVAGRPAILMGSSMGGYLAALYAARHAEVEKLVLLAPAFQFPQRWRQRYSEDELARWKREGSAPVFHYGHKEERMLGYQLMEDSQLYEGEPNFTQPGLIFHGTRDTVVPAEVSQSFVAHRGNVDLHLLDSGHELIDVLEPMWQTMRGFLRLTDRR